MSVSHSFGFIPIDSDKLVYELILVLLLFISFSLECKIRSCLFRGDSCVSLSRLASQRVRYDNYYFLIAYS